jgi:lysophospholipase L1-like esterase
MSLASQITAGFAAVADKINELESGGSSADPVALRGPAGWGAAFRQALSEADTRLVRVRGVGDSVTQGFSAGTRNDGYFEKIIDALQAEFGDGGDGLTTMAHSTAHLIYAGLSASVTHTGTWTATNVGYGGCALTSAQNGAVITRTNCRGRRVRVYYETKVGGSPFTVHIGGVAQTAVVTNATAEGRSIEYTVPGGTADPYTVTITTGGTGGVTIHAIDCYNTTGVVGHNMARLGNTAAQEIAHPAYTGEASGFLSLLHLNTLPDFATPQNNDLVIASYGINDYDVGTTETAFRYSFNSLMQTAVQHSQGDDNNASSVVITFTPNDAVHSADGNDYFDHTAAQSIVADVWDSAYLNLYARWPWRDAVKVASGLYTTGDGTHPNATGHAWVADHVNPLLLAQNVGQLAALTGPSDTAAINAVIAQRAASGMGFVNHGATAGTVRPTGYAAVTWYGTVQPTNMAVGDIWVDVT